MGANGAVGLADAPILSVCAFQPLRTGACSTHAKHSSLDSWLMDACRQTYMRGHRVSSTMLLRRPPIVEGGGPPPKMGVDLAIVGKFVGPGALAL